jgi:hypothetical protein
VKESRKEGGKSIAIPDPDANPNPTKTDRFVVSLTGLVPLSVEIGEQPR